ncbi:M6 family metalloprotease domain-containing protein [uncultured Thiodictyon sp.]|jgi:M6 family metalloprotease-like protein|uniref:M6 family metalloprotease domain-containing protein n=1 Tax=uncultured Thiodictyon sp. TaxID=1846217 RepID=UPI0025FDB66B|nr:M6 family metalloprotease domain-containing protein [uncultured Thiodictyon sp.]
MRGAAGVRKRWNNWVETEAGYTIARDAQGVWQYVTGFERSLVADGRGAEPFPVERPVLSGVDATEPPPSGILPHLHATTTRPVSPARSLVAAAAAVPGALPVAADAVATRKLLLILAEFNDRKGATAQTAWASGYIERIADYYSKMSFGRIAFQAAPEDDSLLPDPDTRIGPAADNGVIGWVNISSRLRQLEIDHTMSDQTGSHPNTHGDDSLSKYNRLVARAAMMAATPYINWAQYDYDNDGSVTADELAVLVVVAGFEASAPATTATPSIFAHAGDTVAEGELRLGGKLLGVGATRPGLGPMQVTSGYGMFGEQGQEKTTPYQLPIGTPLHELGHSVFALPDLYEVNASTTCPDDSPNRGIGAWSLMASGSDGYRVTPEEYPGTTPVSLDAWSKLMLGWVNPMVARERAELRAGGDRDATADNTVYKVVVKDTETEYFLIENRQNSGFDRGLQWPLGADFAGGVLVYHIDDSIDCAENKCNSRAAGRHPRVHLETGGRACISKDTGWALGSDAYHKGSKGSRVIVFLNATSTPSNSRRWNAQTQEKGLSSGVTIRDISDAEPVMRVRVIKP